jgi:hypothetical protein
MKLHMHWYRPLALRDGAKQNLIYTIDLKKLPKVAGLYVLGRRWGSGFEALYVGKANELDKRVKTQLNNLRLMQHLKNAKGGSRIILAGRLVTRPGQRLDKSLVLVERALIRYFLSEGHDLVNKQGTRLRRHEVTSDGSHPKKFIPREMFVEKAKGE